jgi:hypothetical protein
MRRVLTILVSAVLVSAAGCGGDGLAERACSRASECDLLMGQSESECVEEGETFLDMLSDSEREQFTDLMNMCLDLESCAEFQACIGS